MVESPTPGSAPGRSRRSTSESSIPPTERSARRTITAFVDEYKPEASYFYAENGRRTGLFVFDLKDAAQIPSVTERFLNPLPVGAV